MMTEELKGYFDRKFRLGKLDSALLFLSSSIGLIFAVAQSIEESPASLVFFAPAFFLGWILPFYYGYVRGALVRDSIVDRLRGWIYFIAGLGMYFLMAVSNPLFERFAPADSATPNPALFLVAALIVFVILTGYFVLKSFTRFIFALADQKPNGLTFHVAVSTGATSAFIAIFGWFVTRLRIFTVYSLVFLIPFALVILYFWNKSDWYASGAVAGIDFTVVRRPRWLNGRKVPTFLKDTLIVVMYAVWVTAAVLIYLGYDLTGFTLLLVEVGLAVVIPTWVLSYLTGARRHLKFATPPRKPRKKALVEILRRPFLQG